MNSKFHSAVCKNQVLVQVWRWVEVVQNIHLRVGEMVVDMFGCRSGQQSIDKGGIVPAAGPGDLMVWIVYMIWEALVLFQIPSHWEDCRFSTQRVLVS